MFQIEGHNQVVVRHRSGRLLRPSDHVIPLDGLGGVDGFLDILKNFGSGIVKYATAGLYDPSKNRFYVPFSSGQMRNWAQGFVNTSTFGLVKTDKFFNSQTMRTIGTVAGAAAAGATAYFGGQMLASKFGSGGSSSLFGGGAKAPVGGTAPVSAPVTAPVAAPTSSLFNFGNISKVLDLGTKVMGSFGGGGAQQQMPQGGSAPVVVVAGGAPPPEMYPPMLAPIGPGMMPGPGLPLYDPSMVGPFGGGGGAMPISYGGGGGGGGGFGPPGSEFAGMNQQEVQQAIQEEEGMSTTTKFILIGGGVLVLYYLAKKK